MFALILAILSIAHSLTVVDCLKGKGSMTLKNITMKPDPPIHGRDLDVTAYFNCTQKITVANCQLVVKKLFIPIHRENFDLCAGLKCPLSPGIYDTSLTIPIPSYTPTGSYDLEVHCADAAKKEILCTEAKIAWSFSLSPFL